ncbi:hypothetical protein GTY54_19895 [Streptomyces sp. SID625]|nr:hypothetical protein [Streptomyces sp. SID625]
MSRDFAEILEAATPTAEVMEVDTSFLDAYRRGGSEELRRVQAQAARPEPEVQCDEADVASLQPEVRGPQTDPDVAPEADGLDLEPDYEPDADDSERSGGSNRRAGGNGGGQGGTAAGLAGAPASPAVDAAPAPGEQPHTEDAAEVQVTAGSLQLTDHQDAVQSAAPRGDTGSTTDTAMLPQSGFRLAGVQSQPHIRALPESIVNALREQLRAAAVRELGVSDSAAREFSQRLSQGTLVTAFLAAALDLCLDADPATGRAIELFRSRDPLLGSAVARLANIEAAECERAGVLRKLRDELGELRQTSAVLEQALAYSIADRTENFLRGSHNLHDAPITHKAAIHFRDMAREATRKQLKLEREREGRPIR